jgi:hypothetical protein
MNRKFAIWPVAAMLGGIVAGLVCHAWLGAPQLAAVTNGLGIVTTIFLRPIKMIIAPLVFSADGGHRAYEGCRRHPTAGRKDHHLIRMASLI